MNVDVAGAHILMYVRRVVRIFRMAKGEAKTLLSLMMSKAKHFGEEKTFVLFLSF